MANYVQSNQIVRLPYINSNIGVADTGKVMLTPQTAGAVDVIYTLPTLAPGLHYRFINSAPAALDGTVRINATSIHGNIINGPVGGVELKEISGDTQMVFVTGTSVLGDFLDFICDGTNWYVEGRSSVSGGIE